MIAALACADWPQAAFGIAAVFAAAAAFAAWRFTGGKFDGEPRP